MKLRIAITDDDKNINSTIALITRTFFSSKGIDVDIEQFFDLENLDHSMKEKAFDLLLLDISFPFGSGITYATANKDLLKNSDVIFISNREDLVFESFSAQPFGFVRKSHFAEDLENTLSSYIAQERDFKEKSNIIIHAFGEDIKLDILNIIYIESFAKYQIIHTMEGEPLKTRLSMNQYEDALKGHRFLRAHKSYLVNSRYVKRFSSEYIEVINGDKIPMNPRKAGDIRKEYLKMESQFDSLVL